MRYHVGQIAVRAHEDLNQFKSKADPKKKVAVENFLEEFFGIPYAKKTIDYSKGIHTYHNCLVTDEQLEAMKPHWKRILAWKLDEQEIPHVFRLYSDGGSFNNGKKNPNKPEYGAYGAVVTGPDGEVWEELSYGEENWTNNIGELTGAIRAIETLLEYDMSEYEGPINVVLVTDSQYVSKGATDYINGWIQRGWRNNQGVPTPNRPLWERMLELLRDEQMVLRFRWVRGHTLFDDDDSKLNERCDTLASEYLRKMFGV